VRHLISLLLGLVIAPAVWIAAGLGQARLMEATDPEITLRGAFVPLAVLAGAGLVFGLIATTRVSPAGPLVAGLLLLGIQIAYLARPETVTGFLPKKILGTEGALTLPAATGLGAVLGVGLMVALFSLGRWRNWPYDDSPSYAFLGDSGPVSSSRRTYDEESTGSYRTASSDETTRNLSGSGSWPTTTSGPAWGQGETGSGSDKSPWNPSPLR
jgi:hypothetical protein